ncbi:unnamed protein product, partial [Didymodactylos carnosus]
MPESPYFLYSKKECHKLEQLLRQIAELNQRQESDCYPYYQELLKTTSLRVLQQKKLSYIRQIKELLTHVPTIRKLLIIGAIGFTILLSYSISKYPSDWPGILLLLHSILPESPRSMVSKGRFNDAEKVLKCIATTNERNFDQNAFEQLKRDQEK